VTDRVKSDVLAVVQTLCAGTDVQQWVGTVGFGALARRQATCDEPVVGAMIAPWPATALQL
jgi:hypothetical protein